MPVNRAERVSAKSVLRAARRKIEKAGSDTPYLDALLLLSSTMGVTREELYARAHDTMTDTAVRRFESLLERRLRGEPIAYILGRQEFYGLSFTVDRRVLVPRPDSELLVDVALRLLSKRSAPRVHDSCTGSGCIGIALAHERPDAFVSLSDVSADSLEIALENAGRILDHTIPIVESDLLDRFKTNEALWPPELRDRYGPPFDMITCNPPYLTTWDMQVLRGEIRASSHSEEVGPAAAERVPATEPALALDGGSDGLDIVRRLIRTSLATMSKNGYILIEAADAQSQQIELLLRTAGFTETFIERDLSGMRRVIGGVA